MGVEDEVAGRSPGKAARAVAGDLQHLPLLVSKVSDVVVAAPPSLAFLQGLSAAGFTPGKVVASPDAVEAPVIGGLRDGPVETALTRRVRQDAVLSAYVDRMRETVPV